MDGIVQGVGFRSFVHRTASTLGLSGWAADVDGHVEGEVAGEPGAVDEFAARLRIDAPALVRVRHVRLTPGRLDGEPVTRSAAAFHLTLATVTADLVARAVADGAPRTVCLGGGCFVNRLRALGGGRRSPPPGRPAREG
jgi:hydrogenase maturation protein HypF